MSRTSKCSRALLNAGVDFHGHLGPYLVLGLRMGMIAVHMLKPKGLHELSATVWTRLSPPQSCLLDGVQVSSGCTLGKGNIRAVASQRTTAKFRKGNSTLVVELTNKAKTLLSRITKHTPQLEIKKTALILHRMPDRQLFIITQDG